MLGSRFIATAEPIQTMLDPEIVLERLRREYFTATHHCYAYRLGPTGDQFRANDSGEPAGSAGKPILAAIERVGLTNVMVVVIRYFGGTKLGVRGLVHAYGDVATSALLAAEPLICYISDTLDVVFPHNLVSNVMHVVGKTGARIKETTYDEDVHLILEIRRSKTEELKGLLLERTSGNISVKYRG
jgi:uncharacterized YigZ family protein